MKCLIWRDAIDPNYYAIGVRMNNGKVSKWADLFVDCIFDCFGVNSEDLKQHISTTPVEVDLALKFGIGVYQVQQGEEMKDE